MNSNLQTENKSFDNHSTNVTVISTGKHRKIVLWSTIIPALLILIVVVAIALPLVLTNKSITPTTIDKNYYLTHIGSYIDDEIGNEAKYDQKAHSVTYDLTAAVEAAKANMKNTIDQGQKSIKDIKKAIDEIKLQNGQWTDSILANNLAINYQLNNENDNLIAKITDLPFLNFTMANSTEFNTDLKLTLTLGTLSTVYTPKNPLLTYKFPSTAETSDDVITTAYEEYMDNIVRYNAKGGDHKQSGVIYNNNTVYAVNDHELTTFDQYANPSKPIDIYPTLNPSSGLHNLIMYKNKVLFAAPYTKSNSQSDNWPRITYLRVDNLATTAQPQYQSLDPTSQKPWSSKISFIQRLNIFYNDNANTMTLYGMGKNSNSVKDNESYENMPIYYHSYKYDDGTPNQCIKPIKDGDTETNRLGGADNNKTYYDFTIDKKSNKLYALGADGGNYYLDVYNLNNFDSKKIGQPMQSTPNTTYDFDFGPEPATNPEKIYRFLILNNHAILFTADNKGVGHFKSYSFPSLTSNKKSLTHVSTSNECVIKKETGSGDYSLYNNGYLPIDLVHFNNLFAVNVNQNAQGANTFLTYLNPINFKFVVVKNPESDKDSGVYKVQNGSKLSHQNIVSLNAVNNQNMIYFGTDNQPDHTSSYIFSYDWRYDN